MTMTRATWEKMVAEWRTSGQSARAFASTRSVTDTAFRYWVRRLGGKKGIAVTAPTTAPPLARVVREKSPAPASSRVVVVVGHAKIFVETGFDAKHLRDVVRALGELA